MAGCATRRILSTTVLGSPQSATACCQVFHTARRVCIAPFVHAQLKQPIGVLRALRTQLHACNCANMTESGIRFRAVSELPFAFCDSE